MAGVPPTLTLTQPATAGDYTTPMTSTAESTAGGGTKSFVVDTNVLLHNPDALFVFEDNHVVVPFAVVEELDEFKRGNDDLARNARRCIHHLDKLRQTGRLTDGVRWGDADTKSGTVRIAIDQGDRPAAISKDTPDNRIIGVAYSLKTSGERAIFVSKDINARIKADALGLIAQDFEHRKVDADRLFRGHVEIDTTSDVIDELYEQRMLPLERLGDALRFSEADGTDYTHELSPNEFVVLKDANDESHSGLARRLADTNHLIPVSAPRKPVFGVMARNTEQTLALDLLLDDDVRLVTLTGGAGTGKTLMALAAGMMKVYQEERYDKLLVARPIVPMGKHHIALQTDTALHRKAQRHGGYVVGIDGFVFLEQTEQSGGVVGNRFAQALYLAIDHGSRATET